MTSFNKILTKGYHSSLESTPIENDKLRFTLDTCQLFLDENNERREITDFVKGLTEEEVRAVFAPLPKFYYASDTQRLLYNTGDEWIVIAERNYDVAPFADEANHAEEADHSLEADHATEADLATNATNADNADEATHAVDSDNAKNAEHADLADNATEADHAEEADHATDADNATKATNDANGKPINTTYAPLQSPILIGTPTTPTPAEDSSDNQIANTEFVKKALEKVYEAIGGITQIKIEFCEDFDSLPETGVNGTFYFVPKEVTEDETEEENNIFEEYLWIVDKYEKIGSTKVDLSGYFNSIETTGTGNAITEINGTGNKLSAKKGATFLTSHPSVTTSTGTTTAAPDGGNTFTAVSDLTTDANGHVTSFKTKTVTVPDKVTNADEATHATSADTATKATSADKATKADSATTASVADKAKGIQDDCDFDFGDLDA